MIRRGLAVFVLSLLALADATAADPEAKIRSDAARLVAEYAAWCAANGARSEGLKAAEEAASLDPAAPKLEETKGALEALAEDAPDAGALAKQRKTVGPRVAALYEKLAASASESSAVADDRLFRAVAWDPAASRIQKVRRAIDDAASSNRADVAGRLLVRLKRADRDGAAQGRYDKLEIEMASKDAVLLGSESHDLVGYVSLPKGWAKGKSYPVLVDVDGAGSNFLGSLRSFASARASRPVILLAPVTFSNTNDLDPKKYAVYPKALVEEWNAKNGRRHEFDGPGVDALLEVIRKRFGGEEKVFLTGFSGGGQYTYWKLFQDPAHVRGAAPACANFAGAGLQGAPGAGADGGPPVHLLTGEKDPHRDAVFGKPPGIEQQTDHAEENLRRLGYKRVQRTMVKGAGHDAFPALVWKFVDSVLEAR